MVLQHHERLDGSGYPRGLAGAGVLPEARILAVADVVEAMSSHRPYRPALGMAAALAEVRAHFGVKYDAEVVATCVRLVEAQGFAFAPCGQGRRRAARRRQQLHSCAVAVPGHRPRIRLARPGTWRTLVVRPLDARRRGRVSLGRQARSEMRGAPAATAPRASAERS
jgi:hypothetical protein